MINLLRDEQHISDYLDLINALIECPTGEELDILNDHRSLVDEGLIQTMEKVALELEAEEEFDTAKWLYNAASDIKEIIQKWSELARREDYLDFLLQVLEAIDDSEADPEGVYPLLEANLDKLNEDLAWVLQNWATETLVEVDSEKADSIAADIGSFSILIQEFTSGEIANNIEIAITGYRIVAKILNKEQSPEEWWLTQHNLGFAYYNRIAGNRSRNLEKAVDCYQLALLAYNVAENPEEWGLTQNNLGLAYLNRIEGDSAENQESAIAAFQSALKVRDRENYPKEWAETQNNLGLLYFHRTEGDTSDNIERAISYYQAALSAYPKEVNPVVWATLKNNLGLAYYNRIEGEKGDNIERAIAAFEAALEVRSYEEFPLEWAETLDYLGEAYNERIIGEKSDNLEQAIRCYEATLKTYLLEEFPEEWAKANTNLGWAYFERINGNRAENLEISINTFKSALRVYNPDNYLSKWIITVYYLGLFYIHRIQGKRSHNLERAIHHYKQALKFCTPEDFPEEWGLLQNDLGVVYLERIKGNRQENIEAATAAFEATLQVFDKDDCPDYWALTQTNLGWACYNRLSGNYSDNIEKAIAFYKSGLEVCDFEKFKFAWVLLKINLGVAYLSKFSGNISQNIETAIQILTEALELYVEEGFLGIDNQLKIKVNLGLAYYKRVKGKRAENVEKSIEYYQLALQDCSPEIFAYQWGTIQNNLGLAYISRIQGDVLENRETAIATLKLSLQVRTREDFPKEWAATQQNIGMAYNNRVKGDRSENLEMAIKAFNLALKVYCTQDFTKEEAAVQYFLAGAYINRMDGKICENIELAINYCEKALKVYNREAYPVDWATLQNNLGNAYSERIEGDEDENLETAILYYKAGLEIYNQEEFPEDWAALQNNLGNAYSDRTIGNETENLATSILYYKAALQVYNREDFPEDWAMVQHNIGVVYNDRGNALEAIACLESALEIRTPTTFPKDCLNSGSLLGYIALNAGDWNTAIKGYSLAIAALEQLRIWAKTEERRQEILESDIDAYENIVQAFVNTGKLAQAFEYVERSRSRRLVDLIASNDLYKQGEIPLEVQKYLRQFEALQQRIDRERFGRKQSTKKQQLIGVGANILRGVEDGTRSRAALEAFNEKITALEYKKQQLWQKLRYLDPVLAGEIQVSSPSLTSIQTSIDRPNTAILCFYTTESDTYIFVLQQEKLALHTINGQGYETLQQWIDEHWLKPYSESSDLTKPNQEKERLKTTWRNQFTSFFTELAERLQLDELINQHLTNIEEIIIVPHLYLHQIPFAALPTGNGQYLGDKFLIRYTPSCQVLEFCQQRPPIDNTLTYGIVEDATEDLPCATFEAEQIAQLYNIPEEQRLRGRSQATVNNYRQLAKQVQAIVSSHHAQSRLDNPLESRLELADGSITLGQLMTPGWRMPHLSDVFLSCCETGLGVTEITDDILTLSTGFLCAGARSVVSTLWAVDDLATALFSIFYHQQRQQGYNRPESLQQAQISLRTLTGEQLKTNYHTQLLKLLEQKFEQAENSRQEAEDHLNVYPKNSVEYREWLQEEEKRATVATRIYNALERLDILCVQNFPFSHPFYWAAFTCSGLR